MAVFMDFGGKNEDFRKKIKKIRKKSENIVSLSHFYGKLLCPQLMKKVHLTNQFSAGKNRY
jgi:hypothetical protein